MRYLLALVFYAILAACLTTPARADNAIARALVEISLRASLEATSHITLGATSDETSPHSRACERRRRYETCQALDPKVGDQLVREAYAFDGPLLRDFADGLEVAPEDLAALIVQGFPANPTRQELSAVLIRISPTLSRLPRA